MLPRKCPFCGATFVCTGDCILKEKMQNYNFCICFRCLKNDPSIIKERYMFFNPKPNTFKEKIVLCYGQDFIDSQIIDEI